MVTKDHTQVIQGLFAASDRAFGAGDNKLGSLKLWEAAECALKILAESRGWLCQTIDDHFDILERLAAENGNDGGVDLLGANYQAAGYFRNNADYDFMEGYAIRGGRPLVRQFVADLLGVAEQSAL